MVQDVELKPLTAQSVEAHRSYIDIHVPLSGPEVIGVYEMGDEEISFPFDEKNDCVVFKANPKPLLVRPGEYAIFFPPHGGHAPGCQSKSGVSTKLRKIVVKVRDKINPCSARITNGEACPCLVPGEAEVLIAPDACPIVRFAADEMTNYLSRVLGAAVPLVTAPTDGRLSVVLGENEWSRAAGLDPSAEPRDTFFIKAEGSRLYICGRDDPSFNLRRYLARGRSFGVLCHHERATVHGVYVFLEKYADVRFYWPDEELGVVVPKADRIEVPDVCTKTTPEFLLRDPYFNGDGVWYSAADPEVDNGRIKAKLWMRHRFSSTCIPCCHGIRKLKLRERFGRMHPEFFPIPGKNEHLCWTNPELRKIIYQDVKKRLQAGETVVDIMPDDGFRPCPCARCQAAYEKEKGSNGYASSLIWGFAAEVGNRLKAEGVNGSITMMAYSPYRSLPDFEIPSNVKVMVAEYGPWSLTQPGYARQQYDEIRAWQSKTGGKVWIWTYPYKHGRLAIRGVPQMAPHAWAEYYRAVRDAVFGVFAECESDDPLYNYLNYYVFSRVMWDVSADVDALIAEHDRLLYGPAAADMHAFNAQLEEAWTQRVAGSCFMDELGPVPSPPCALELWTSVYDREFLRKLAAHLDAASAKVASGSLEARRIALMRSRFYEPLVKASEDFRRSIDVEAERAWRRAHPEATDLFAGKGISEDLPFDRVQSAVSTGEVVHAFACTLADGALCLKPNTRYRISFFLKLDDVKPTASGGGVSFVLWDAKNNWFPRREDGGALVGTTGWIAQHAEITTDPETNVKGRSYFRLSLRNATGRIHYSSIRIYELPDVRAKPEGVFPEHRQLALDPACARIVHEKDKAAAQKVAECPLQLPDEIDLPDWPEATNVVYVTDLYWYPYMDFRALNPYAQYTVPARLPRKPALPLSAWDRMPSDYMTVICTSGRTDEPPPDFFLKRGFRVRLDGRDLPLKTEPSNGARKILEIRPRPGNPRNSEGDFVRLKDGTLLFAWSRYYEAGAKENSSWDNGGADIVLRRSEDNGETWSTEDEMLVRNDAMNVMSVSFLRLADGRIALFYIRKLNAREDEILMRTSADEAKTWSEAATVTGCLPKGWYVLNNARVVQLGSGRILVPLAFHRMKTGGGKDPAATLVCAFSDDGGATWRAGASVDVCTADGCRVDTQEPGVVELKDGRVMMWARTSFGSQYAGVSSDGGETWGPFGPSGLVGPRSPATVRRLGSGALVAVWNDHRLNPELVPRGRRAPLSVALSHDEGRTWGTSVPIEENLTDFLCYTALYEREDGILLAYCTKETRNLDSIRMAFVPNPTKKHSKRKGDNHE